MQESEDDGEIFFLHLGDGLLAAVDLEDQERVEAFLWRLRPDGYVQSSYHDGKRMVHELLHRFVMKAAPEDLVDHVDGNRVDCRKRNLRVITLQQNSFNRAPCEGRQWKGIYAHGLRWKARIKIDGRTVYLGAYDTAELAAHAYDEAARRLFGEFARLNFP